MNDIKLRLKILSKDDLVKAELPRNSKSPMLTRAGREIARANNNVLIPRAPFTSLRTRPTRMTRTTLKIVGGTDSTFFMKLSKIIANKDSITITKSKTFHGILKYRQLSANNFITHSAVNIIMNILFTSARIASVCSV